MSVDCLLKAQTLIRIREFHHEEIQRIFLERWQTLAARSSAPNTFLSPEFILAYLRHFPRERPPILLTGEDRQTGELQGLGLFEQSLATKALPLPHLVPWQCQHLYRQGLLIAEDASAPFLDALLTHFCHEQEDFFGIEFQNLDLQQPWVRQLREAAIPFGCSFRLTPRFESPAADLKPLRIHPLESQWSASRRKTMRRNRNRLEKIGQIDFHVIQKGLELRQALERFLTLESSGWKGERGTSLLSTTQDSQFIRELVEQAAKAGQVLISELTVDGEVAACALNLKAGQELFAFKIGWNDKFAEASPGMLHEAELIKYLSDYYPEIQRVDSCARADSYLKGIWTDRLSIGDGLLSITTLARGTGKLISKLRHLKRWAREQMKLTE